MSYIGYVVAIINPLTYLVNVKFPLRVKEKYDTALSGKYKYISEISLNGNGISEHKLEDTYYVCRLNNIESIPEKHHVIYGIIKTYFEQTGNWIYVTPYEVDSFKRILIDIGDKNKNSLSKLLISYKDEIVKTYEEKKYIYIKKVDIKGICHKL